MLKERHTKTQVLHKSDQNASIEITNFAQVSFSFPNRPEKKTLSASLSHTLLVLQLIVTHTQRQSHFSSHLVFEWYSISSASRQSPCSRGPRVRTSITMATQPNNLSGDRNAMPPIVMAASAAAHTLGKFPRGRGMRASSSLRLCICRRNSHPVSGSAFIKPDVSTSQCIDKCLKPF